MMYKPLKCPVSELGAARSNLGDEGVMTWATPDRKRILDGFWAKLIEIG